MAEEQLISHQLIDLQRIDSYLLANLDKEQMCARI